MKFIRREIGKIVRYLPDKNKTSAASQTVARPTARIAPKISNPNSLLTVIQISSKSVHFRRSYSRTRENRFMPRRVSIRTYKLFGPIKHSVLCYVQNGDPADITFTQK